MARIFDEKENVNGRKQRQNFSTPTHLVISLPIWLVVVLGGEDTGVEEDQGEDQPEHELGLTDVLYCSSIFPVPPEKKDNKHVSLMV